MRETADEGRSAFSAKDGKTRVGEKLFNERINLYSDPMHADLPAVPSTDEGIPGVAAVAHQGRRAREPRVLAVLGAGAQARANAGPVNYIMESTQPPVRSTT